MVSLMTSRLLIVFDELRDVIKVIWIKFLVLSVHGLLFIFLLVKVVHGSDLLLFGLVGLSLELFHQLDLIRQPLSPELLPFIILGLPI